MTVQPVAARMRAVFEKFYRRLAGYYARRLQTI